jgi:hypothetical protein
MQKVYVVGEDGRTTAMDPVHCANEDKELQAILERNLELLPGDQIEPDDPRRWMCIKREMPVQDPTSGGDRWSVDFFLVDQSGIPTFVECKRFRDTRSRREVVGQMLEYAANGNHYWSRDMIRSFAEATAAKRGLSLEDALRALEVDDYSDVETFLELVEGNLREGIVRLVFFLEEAPRELKSIVEFLNRQMERTDVLVVEAKQFTDGNTRVIAPTLFGYTEEARLAKQKVVLSTGRRRWNKVAFFADAERKLSQEQQEAVGAVYHYATTDGYDVRWGNGGQRGSFNLVLPAVSNKSVLSVFSDGAISLNLGWLTTSADTVAYRDMLARTVQQKCGLQADVERYPNFTIEEWAPKRTELIAALEAARSAAPNPAKASTP